MSDVSYPKSMVTTCYALFGGAVGGLLAYACLTIYDPKSIFDKGLEINLKILSYLLYLSVLTGSFPAICTGLYLSFKKFVINNIASYFKVFIIGTIITAIYMLGYWLWLFLNDLSQAMLLEVIALLMLLVSGLSTVIVGYFVLPKHKEIL